MAVAKRIWKMASAALAGIAVVLAVALVGVRLVGLDVYAVLSGSMEPTYETGSVIWVADRDPGEIEVGDPITFVLNEDLAVATHRVIAIDEEAGEFTTKGDANDAPDGSPVLFENLIGEPVLTVPYLGYLVSYVQSPPGLYVAMAACAVLLMLMLLPDLLAKEEGPGAERREREAAEAARRQRAGAPGRHAQAQPAASAMQAPRDRQARTAPPAQARQPAYAASRPLRQGAAFRPQVAAPALRGRGDVPRMAAQAPANQTNNPRLQRAGAARCGAAFDSNRTASSPKGGK